jgi:SAM-dependent methyltransferase
MDFEHVAKAWARWWPLLERGAGAMSLRLVALARLAPGERVLDLATGLGEPALLAAKAVLPNGRVVAIDVSEGMLSLARERAEREGIKNVEFVQADAAAYGDDEHRFDAILSRWGLMFLPDLDASLAHYRRRLREGGRFAAAVWGAPSEVPLISLPGEVAVRQFGQPPPPLEGGPFALHDAVDLRRRFEGCGYRDVTVEDVLLTFPFASASEYFEHIADVAPPVTALLARLGETQRAEFRKAVEALATERFAGDGELRFPNRAIAISAARGN